MGGCKKKQVTKKNNEKNSNIFNRIINDGTVIAIPAEAKHWHGAAKDSWFQHLTYHKDVQEGASNEWLEPVTDEVYGRLP